MKSVRKVFGANNMLITTTVLKPNSKTAKQFVNNWMYSKYDDISKAYKNPSKTKFVAFKEIKDEMDLIGGSDLRITGAGADYFSCAYKVKSDEGLNYLIYYTYLNRYCIQLSKK